MRAVHSVQCSSVKMPNCLSLILTRGEDGVDAGGSEWEKRGGGGGGGDEAGQVPKGGLRCFSDHWSPAPSPPPPAPSRPSFFCSVALKSPGMSFRSLGSALEWELALGRAFRPSLPSPSWKALFREVEGWLMTVPPRSPDSPTLPPFPFQSHVSHILIFVYLQSVICGISLVVNSHPPDRVPFFWAAFLGVI